MDSNWKAATKELRAQGIRITTSVKSCCGTCITDEQIPPDGNKPIVYAIKQRFDTETGGWLYHQDLANTPFAETFAKVLRDNGIILTWDRTQEHTIKVAF